MIKLILCLLLLFCCDLMAQAQQPNLWQSLPLDFDSSNFYTPRASVVYFDSINNTSYIAGAFQKVNDSISNVVAWNGGSYTLLPSSPLIWTNCMMIWGSKLYVGGGNGLACWDGHYWTKIGADSLAGVDCMTLYQGNLLLGTYYYTGNGNEIRPSISLWNGTTLTDLYRVDTLLGTSGWTIKSIAYYKGELYIGGNINVDTPIHINEIARFDGTRWRDVGNFQDGSLDDVRKLLVWKDTLYVAGSFEETNGSPGNGIVKWDGHNWHRLNDGVWQDGGPAITDLMVFNDALYACGWFYTVDGINQGVGFHGFAKWDGRRWCTLGTTANNVIFNLGRFRDSLYIMGGFDTLNGQPMHYMAKWIGGDYTDSCSQPDTTTGISGQPEMQAGALNLFPNPAFGLLNVSIWGTFPGESPAEIMVMDLTGRVVENKALQIKPGENLYQLNISLLVPGMYFLKLQNGQQNMISKFIKK